jgi:hypothetical protein
MLNCLISHGVGHDMKKADKDKSMPTREVLCSFSRSDKPIEVKHKKSQGSVNGKKK